MPKNIVTLYIDDTSLRLMVSEGRTIREWLESPLEPGLVQKNVVMNEAEVTARLQQLFKRQKLATGKITVGVSGLQCLSRPIFFPQLPREMLDEAVKREAKRVLPVPPEQLHISWQTIPAPEGKAGVFLVAIPRRTVDSLLKALHGAGLKPYFLDVKPMLLTRVVSEATAVIVDVQTAEFDIVVMGEGIPQPVRTMPFADEALAAEERLRTIRNELDRTITFYNSNNPEKNLAATVPIYVSGELAGKPEWCQALSNELGHPVLPLPLPVECPAGLDPNRYTANIGLVLQQVPRQDGAGASLVSMNALPLAYRPKPISPVSILALPGAAVAAALLVALWMMIQSTAADIADTRAQVAASEQLLQQRQAQSRKAAGQVTGLEKKVAELEASARNLTTALGTLQKERTSFNRGLEVTLNNRLTGVSLTSINHDNKALTISGRAADGRDVLSYLKGLNNCGQFSRVTMTSGTGEGGTSFTLVATYGERGRVADSIDIAINRLPGLISLTSISQADKTLDISGKSPDRERVFLYLSQLDASGKFGEITYSITTTKEGETQFSLTIKIKE